MLSIDEELWNCKRKIFIQLVIYQNWYILLINYCSSSRKFRFLFNRLPTLINVKKYKNNEFNVSCIHPSDVGYDIMTE